MASAHIQALLQPPSVTQSHKKSLNLVDSAYPAWDALQGDSDFDDTVQQEAQRTEALRTKLNQSQANLDAFVSHTRDAAGDHLHMAQELSLLRHSLADELSFLSQDLVSISSEPDGAPTLLEDIETMHRGLQELESIKGYIQTLQHVLQLSEDAVSEATTASSPLSAVPKYAKLQQFVATVAEACAPVADASGQQKLHLTVFLENIRNKTWLDIKNVLISTLVTAAEKLKWPGVVEYATAPDEDRKSFEVAFILLLKLQEEGQRLQATDITASTEKSGLYPIQALAQPIAVRFKYHFEGTRQTNRLDKPEWYFTHVLNAAHEHREFMDTVVQRLVSSSGYPSINAWREFTRLLFPLLSRKLRRTIPSLISHPPILAHTIYQALAFDSGIRDEGFDLQGTSLVTDGKTQKWEGISDIILGNKGWFEAWMEGEKKFAMDQYMEIITASDAWLVADDHGEEEHPHSLHDLKPTNSARKVKALVEQVTDRYSPLPQFSHRTQFLIHVQVPLLESYHARISSSLDAFETLSSSFLRAVPGALTSELSGRANDPKRLTSGVEGVQRLCKALVSANYISGAMEGWGEDLFFLELWAEINRRASSRTIVEGVHSLPDPKPTEDEVPEGTIFEDLVVQYNKLGERAEDIIVHTVCGEVEHSFKAHYATASSSHATPMESDAPSDIGTVAATLLVPIAHLSAHLKFLHSVLPQKIAASIYRRIANSLASHFMQHQITYRARGSLSLQEGKVLSAEFELWSETCRLALARVPSIRPEAPWRALLQAGRIVGAEGEMWQHIVEATFGMNEDLEWEKSMLDLTGYSELSRVDTEQIIRTRANFV